MISFLKELFFLDDSVIVGVIDVDMNLNPESLDSILAHLFSDSDLAGIKVDAVETSVSSRSFVVSISISQNLPSSGNRLYVISEDELFAKYDDYKLPKPFSKSDHLEIDSLAKLDSVILYIERLEILPPTFFNGVGGNL